jgi:hypothetical protein
MTLGIVVCLKNSTLLIADGMLTKPYQNNEAVTSDCNKIKIINQNLGCIEFGLDIPTGMATAQLSKNLKDFHTPEEVVESAKTELFRGWAFLLLHLSPSVDVYYPSFKSALALAGFIPEKHQFFIGGVLQKIDSTPSTAVNTIADNYILLTHGDEANAKRLFQKYLEELHQSPELPAITKDNRVNLYLYAGAKTIRAVEKTEPTVGGTIRYLVITGDSAPIQGTL